MSFLDAVVQALRLLRAHKLRAALTLFGLVWGTAAVILLVSWGRGVSEMLEDAFFKTGRNLGQIWAGRIGEDFTPAVDRRYLWLTYEDMEGVRQNSRLAELVGAETRRYLTLAWRQRALNVDTRGVEPVGLEIRGVPVSAGRGFTQSDLDHRRRVVLLGFKLRRKLLGAQGGIGAWVRIDGQPFQVVGFLDRVGTQFGRDGDEIDDQAWIPITTFDGFWPAEWTDDFTIGSILYRMRDRHQLDESEAEIRAIVARRLGVSPTDKEAVLAWSPLNMLRELPTDQMNGLNFVLALATLVIGGIGVLNMMLESVHERSQEIGVRLAVGARRRDVVMQFFLETLTLVSLGGTLGVIAGVLACTSLSALSRYLVETSGADLVPEPILQLDIVLIALFVMLAVGIAAGVIPASRAARIDPAITLRME